MFSQLPSQSTPRSVRKLKMEDKRAGPFEYLDWAPDGVEDGMSKKSRTTNVISAAITGTGTVARLKDHSVDRAYRSTPTTMKLVPCRVLYIQLVIRMTKPARSGFLLPTTNVPRLYLHMHQGEYTSGSDELPRHGRRPERDYKIIFSSTMPLSYQARQLSEFS